MMWQSVAEGIAQARREKGVRERRDIPQEEIAGAVGVTVAAYSRWEKGQRVPREEDVRKLADYFGVSPAYLRYGVGSGAEAATQPGGTAVPGVPAGALPGLEPQILGPISEDERRASDQRRAARKKKPRGKAS